MFIVLKPSGEFFRAEHDVRRAERFKEQGLTVHFASVQDTGQTRECHCPAGVLTIGPGRKDWKPKTDEKTASVRQSKKLDADTRED